MTDTVDKIIIQSETQGVQQSTNDVQGLTKAMDGVTVASQNVERSTGSIDSKFASLGRRFGSTASNAAQLEKIQNTLNSAVAANPRLQEEANEIWEKATARYGAATSAVKNLAEAHKGLNAQGQAALHSVRSVVEQLALGVPPTQALTGQLNHLSFAASGEGGLAGAFKQVGSLLSGLVTPTTAVIAGTVALTAAAAALALQYDKVSVSAQRAISGAGQRTGTSVSDINTFVSQNSGLSGTSLSSKEARGLAEDFTKTGEVVISRLHGMSDAVVGFANQTGKSIDEAKKDFVSFAVDPQKGLEELSKTYGSFDVATRKAVDALVLADDKTGAFQVVIDALAEKSKSAAGNMGVMEKATRSFINVLATETTKPIGLEQQIENVKTQLNEAISTAPIVGPAASQNIERLSKEFADLQQAIEKVKAANAAAEFNKLSTAADLADRALIPQIDQLEQVRKKIEDLNRAKAAGKTSKYGADVDEASLTAAQNMEQLLVQSQAEAARYNERVKEISASWSEVGQSTALSLRAAQNQLPVFEAVGGAAKMAAQEAADYKNYMDQGKTSTEAAFLAASNLAAAQAQVESAARLTLASLRDQAAVAAAVTGQQRIAAQAQATYNNLVRQGVSLGTASAAASQEASNAYASASASVERQTDSLKDQVSMIKAARDGTEAQTASAIAYKNAVDSGASRTAATALSAQTFALYTERAADSMQRAADASNQWKANLLEGSAVSIAGYSPSGSVTTLSGDQLTAEVLAKQRVLSDGRPVGTQDTFASDGSMGTVQYYYNGIGRTTPAYVKALLDSYSTTSTSSAYVQDQIKNNGGKIGGLDGAIQALQSVVANSSVNLTTITDATSSLQQLYSAKNAAAPDNATKIANDQQFMAWLQTQPQTIENLQAISTLTSEIQSLANSVDSNTGATSANTDALSPYYSQDPRTSHIGFRSQGLATGGEVTVPGGYSANDNMLAQIPVASGEIISVRRPGQNLGGTTQNTYSLGGIHITVQGGATKADANAIGRTAYQAAQNAMRQLQAAGQ